MFEAIDLGRFVAMLFFIVGGVATFAGILNKYVASPIKKLNETMLRLDIRLKKKEKEQREMKEQVNKNADEISKMHTRVTVLETNGKSFVKDYE